MHDKINNISSDAVEKATGRGWDAWIAFIDAGFQLGVQRTIALGQEDLWELLSNDAGISTWLGPGAGGLTLAPGERYTTRDGLSGEVRTVKAGQKVRLTWQPADRDQPTTLQIYLSCPRIPTRRHHCAFTTRNCRARPSGMSCGSTGRPCSTAW